MKNYEARVTVAVSPRHKKMAHELKLYHNINLSNLMREAIENKYKEYKKFFKER